MINLKRSGAHIATPANSRADALRTLGLLTVAWVDGRYHHVNLPQQWRRETTAPRAVSTQEA